MWSSVHKPLPVSRAFGPVRDLPGSTRITNWPVREEGRVQYHRLHMAFSRSSKDISISHSVLTANCRDSDGSYNVSTLDLNDWITNIDGTLRWAEDGKFYDTSKGTSLTDGVTLKAKCKNVDGSYVSSTLNLDEKIANVDGKLVPVVYERALIKADGSNNDAVVRALKDYYDAHKDQVQAEVADGPGYKVMYMCVYQ